ncbi:MAG: hypothetical protein K6E41_08665 [Solobacterium sp.]|nr:hypothetical protein [Solobacterium sp.]
MSSVDWLVLAAVAAVLVLCVRYLLRCRKSSCTGCTKQCTLRRNDQ